MANTPKELRKVEKTGTARVRAADKNKDPRKVPGMKAYRAVSNKPGKKGLKYDTALMKGQDKEIAKTSKRTGPFSSPVAKKKPSLPAAKRK